MQHSHSFDNNAPVEGERRTRWVVIITLIMMTVEITAGVAFGSMALNHQSMTKQHEHPDEQTKHSLRVVAGFAGGVPSTCEKNLIKRQARAVVCALTQ